MWNRYEDPDAEIRERANTYRDAAALFPAIRRTLEAFDGKMFNCRLEKALREATSNRVFAGKRYMWLEIYIYENGNQITLAQIKLEELTDGKRIHAALLIESAREHRESLLQRAADLETAIDRAPAVRQQLQQLEALIIKLRESIPYEARDVYRLDYRVQH